MRIYFKNRGGSFPNPKESEEQYVVLQWDGWNDHSYYTYFIAYICTSKRDCNDQKLIGPIKIMKNAQAKNERTFDTEETGPIELNSGFCSLGLDMKYYQTLASNFDRETAIDYLESVNDTATDLFLKEKYQFQDCFQVSLLRELESRIALDKAGELFGISGKPVEDFILEATLPAAKFPHKFRFDFRKKNGLPHRIQAIVGLNGVGKTQIMARAAMLMSRFSKKSQKEKSSTLETEGKLKPVPSIYNVVAISFSAFDEFDRPTVTQGKRFNYSYCGLRTQRGRLLSEDDLLNNIKTLLKNEIDDEKKEFLSKTLGNIIKVDDIHSFIFEHEKYVGLYDRLSAGQRIVLNALLHAIAKIQPRTLILFDEPELHLHPQLLTTMISSFFEILEKYDSFAIIATHSPLLIQQLPSNCVHVVLTRMFHKPSDPAEL